ncbi:MAG: hypothetical protein JWO09_1828 [Bacteroidetes bacterium]|nr:hypothetical protein [Bacteroidota bacterium]
MGAPSQLKHPPSFNAVMGYRVVAFICKFSGGLPFHTSREYFIIMRLIEFQKRKSPDNVSCQGVLFAPSAGLEPATL